MEAYVCCDEAEGRPRRVKERRGLPELFSAISGNDEGGDGETEKGKAGEEADDLEGENERTSETLNVGRTLGVGTGCFNVVVGVLGES